MDNPITFCQFALDYLGTLKGHEYGKVWCDLKMQFCRQFQDNLIFSTRFGCHFFEYTLEYLNSKTFLIPEKGTQLGEYDKNFNLWLKKWRKTV